MAIFSMRSVFLNFSTFSSFGGFVKFDHFLIGIQSKIVFSFYRILSWKNISRFSSPAFLADRKSSWTFSDASKLDSRERRMVKSVSHGTEFHFSKDSFVFWTASSSFLYSIINRARFSHTCCDCKILKIRYFESSIYCR